VRSTPRVPMTVTSSSAVVGMAVLLNISVVHVWPPDPDHPDDLPRWRILEDHFSGAHPLHDRHVFIREDAANHERNFGTRGLVEADLRDPSRIGSALMTSLIKDPGIHAKVVARTLRDLLRGRCYDFLRRSMKGRCKWLPLPSRACPASVFLGGPAGLMPVTDSKTGDCWTVNTAPVETWGGERRAEEKGH
jgi:hypothetical protein